MVFSGSRGRSYAREPPLQVSNTAVRSGHSPGWWKSGEASAALAGNTSHLGAGLHQYNRPLSRPHTKLAGKGHQWSTRRVTKQGTEKRRGPHLTCLHPFGYKDFIKCLRNVLKLQKFASTYYSA